MEAAIKQLGNGKWGPTIKVGWTPTKAYESPDILKKVTLDSNYLTCNESILAFTD